MYPPSASAYLIAFKSSLLIASVGCGNEVAYKMTQNCLENGTGNNGWGSVRETNAGCGWPNCGLLAMLGGKALEPPRPRPRPLPDIFLWMKKKEQVWRPLPIRSVSMYFRTLLISLLILVLGRYPGIINP